jgi:hypothetical protein
MQKAEAQHGQQNQPSVRQGKGMALDSPQGEQIAQLEAMAERSPQAGKLAQLAAMANGNSWMSAQRKAISAIHSSPNLTAQRRQLDSLSGATAQRAEAFAQPGASIQLSGREGDEWDSGPGQGEQAPPTPRPVQGGQTPPPLPESESLIQDGYSPRAGEERDETAQLVRAGEPSQLKVTQCADAHVKPNNTGLPDNLKSGIESLSGMSMDNVKVHYNSSQPAQLNALAYAQGSDIHVAPGQEQHLPHEAWHVVQQAQGRVKPTMQMKDGVPVNDDAGLEREADVMGARAVTEVTQAKTENPPDRGASTMLQKSDRNWLVQKMASGCGTQKAVGYGCTVQLYSYAAGSTKTITLKNAGATAQTDIEVCTQNSVTYNTGDAKQTGSGTGTASWAGWLTDAGTNNNATQLHVINQHLGGNGGATEGNIGPGSQNLNSHHLHQAEKYVKNELFNSGKATHDFTYTCTFDYSNSVDKVHNTPTAKDTAIGDPAITAKLKFNGTPPSVKSSNVSALESGVAVTNGYDMKFGKA